jgi:acetyl-CoA carboxylase biotin carboxylase subunit
MKRIKKVLIANRGEIALRIMKTCREMHIETVAVFSEADKNSLHKFCADAAYGIGPAPSSHSYLRIKKIIDAAKKSGADAIHPGYGFLAERDDFAQACADEEIIFIGPRPATIATMGNKTTARSVVAKAGVPVVPGTNGNGRLRDEEIMAIAPRIGFPVVIKPTAGGGGKGMRIVDSQEKLPSALASSRREAESAFGNGNVYLEKHLSDARHIEVQIMADNYENIVCLGERECSIQRRHQKLIEESPSPFVNDDQELRLRLYEAARRVAKAAGYNNVGTVEFLVDREKNIYFLEMNTRLQVEHPVTEMVTGINIVKEQISIAQGKPLQWIQNEIELNGWAIECRINAEDPYNDFMPSSGTVKEVQLPNGFGVRVDTAVFAGYAIPFWYDSLIAKVICWGHNRHAALSLMQDALQKYKISGVKTNIPLHQQVLDFYLFQNGIFNTDFLSNYIHMKPHERLITDNLPDAHYCFI